MKSKLSKVITVGILILVVAFVIFMKNKAKKEKAMEKVVLEEIQNKPEISEPVKKPEVEKKVQSEEKQKTVKIDKNILAVVNHFKITKDYF